MPKIIVIICNSGIVEEVHSKTSLREAAKTKRERAKALRIPKDGRKYNWSESGYSCSIWEYSQKNNEWSDVE